VVNKISIIVIPERGIEKRRGGESHDYNLVREGSRAAPFKEGLFSALGRRAHAKRNF